MGCLANAAIGCVIVLSGCSMREGNGGVLPASPVPKATSASAATQSPTRVGPVIGTVQRRHDALVITASGHGPQFTVRDETGQVVAQGLSAEELRRRFGDLHEMYETGVARDLSTPFLDARVDRRTPDERQHAEEGQR